MPAPANDSCASAETLVGISGTVTADNTDWAGTWDTGNDHVFNWSDFSGGRPLWWKWTNPFPFAVDLFVTPSVGKPTLGGIMFGTCGALTLDLSGGHSSLHATYFFGSGSADLLVAPGQTVFIEVEAYPTPPVPPGAPETVEPPSSSQDIYGVFSFDWEARSATFKDAIPDGPLVLEPVSPDVGSGAPIARVLAMEELSGRLYFAWEIDLSAALYAGSCLPDGTDLHTQIIRGGPGDPWMGNASGGQDESANRVCIVYNATGIYLGFGIGFAANDADNLCSLAVDLKCGGVAQTYPPTDATKYAYEVYRYDAGSWSHFNEIIDSLGSEGPPQGVSVLRPYATRMTGSPNDPGRLWIYFGCALRHEYRNVYHSNYPPAELVGIDNAGCDRCYVTLETAEDYADIYLMDDSGDPATRVSRESTSQTITELLSFDPDANWFLSPGSEVVFGDGPWTTNPGDPYPSVYREHVSLVNDDGFPILVSNLVDHWNAGGKIMSDTIEAKNVETATVIDTFTYTDLTGITPAHPEAGLGSALGSRNSCLATARYFNEETSLYERFLSLAWQGDGGNEFYVHTVRSDFASAPRFLVVGDIVSSDVPAFLEGGIYRDQTDGLRNWYGHDANGQIWVYDFCDGLWEVAYDASTNGDGGFEWSIQNGPWIDNALFLLNQENRLRRHPILHDVDVCSVEPITGSGFHAWEHI